jgi:hypothetical protein
VVSHRASFDRAAALRTSAQLGEELLDRVEVGAVGRQIEKTGASCRDRLFDASHLVRGEIVHNDHTGLKRRRKRLLDIGAECGAGHWTIEDQRRDNAALPQSGDEGGGSPMPVRHRSNHPLAAPAAAVQAGSSWSSAGLVEKDEPGRIHIALPNPPAVSSLGDVGTILLGRPQLRSRPRSGPFHNPQKPCPVVPARRRIGVTFSSWPGPCSVKGMLPQAANAQRHS